MFCLCHFPLGQLVPSLLLIIQTVVENLFLLQEFFLKKVPVALYKYNLSPVSSHKFLVFKFYIRRHFQSQFLHNNKNKSRWLSIISFSKSINRILNQSSKFVITVGVLAENKDHFMSLKTITLDLW